MFLAGEFVFSDERSGGGLIRRLGRCSMVVATEAHPHLGLASKLIHILDIDPSRLAALPTWTSHRYT